jgi:hypothetical protein
MVWIELILAEFDWLPFNPLEARKVLRHDLSLEGRTVDRSIEKFAFRIGFLSGFVPFRQRREICGKEFYISEAAFEGFALAEKYYRLARFNPLLDFSQRQCE